MRPIVTDISQGFIGIFNDRRTFIRAHRGDQLALVGNKPGVGHYDLLGLIRTQVSKLLQHLFCGP